MIVAPNSDALALGTGRVVRRETVGKASPRVAEMACDGAVQWPELFATGSFRAGGKLLREVEKQFSVSVVDLADGPANLREHSKPFAPRRPVMARLGK